jgi:D-threo-aldose 1-dehydrogenase
MTGAIRHLLDRGRNRHGLLILGGSALGNLGHAISDDDARGTMDRAWARGIRYFDTAPHYGLGLSERRIGAGLAERPRDEFIISTKVGRLLVANPRPNTWDTDGFAVPGDLHRQWDFSLDGVRRSLDESLTRLRLDAVDIVYAHDPDQAWDGAARAGLASLARLKADGVVNAIGIGTNATTGLRQIIQEGLVDVIMIANRYSLLDQSALEPVLTPALRAGVAVVAAGVFATGLLSTARPTPGATYEYRPASAEIVERTRRIAAVCADHSVDVPAAALAFPQRHPAVAAVAVGMRSAAEVDHDVRYFESDVPEQLWHDLAAEKLIPAASVTAGRPARP